MSSRWLWVGAVVLAIGCAKAGPIRNPDGGARGADAQPPELDASSSDASTTPIDAQTVELDASTPPPIDAWVAPPIDGGPPPGTGAYLDRCTTDAQCADGRCVDDRGGTRFCTRACANHLQCAREHLCVGGVCVPDDTGEPCNTATPGTCSTTLCLGDASSGQCVRDCASAADCPAGHACTTFDGSGRRVCIDVERPCNAASECRTGICIPGIGCTGQCRSAGDCPRRFGELGVPAYTCGTASGVTGTICLPPDDILGDDPIGAFCDGEASLNACRSGVCDPGATPAAMCTQSCTEQGGCAVGLGCAPTPAGDVFVFACQRAGTRDIGAACARGSECHSALCASDGGYCTRLCGDGTCPTGWSCVPVPGVPDVAICRRP
ncbi:hypothetical protein [Sandaracinus amylolyticus]|uniref:hypothetical protein n=1 Tax=Sandaracinus amylolyticus TaxID=927083 RepID=UPI00069FD0AD|nr:hypothetical protein [Sandaracinus amylolyticus]